jgi:hypothetical protein
MAALTRMRNTTPLSALSNEDKLQVAILMSLGFSSTNARRAIKLSLEPNKNRTATVIQRQWRAHVAKRFTDLQKFKTDLQSHLTTNNNRTYYGSLIEKIASQTRKIIQDFREYTIQVGQPPTYVNFKNRVTRNIGPCHVSETNMPIPYLKNFVNGLYFVSNEYSKMSPSRKAAYMTRVVSEIGGRPCIENFMEALQSALYEPTLTWSGRNISPLLFPARTPNRSTYLALVARALGTYMSNKTKAELRALPTNNARIQKFWNVIKNKQLSVVNHNGNPAYIAVKNYNVNGRVFKNSGAEAANYVTLNYLN